MAFETIFSTLHSQLFSYLADISEKFLYEIETGKKSFSANTLTKIAGTLEVSLDCIMLGKGSSKYEDEIVGLSGFI